MRGVANCLSRAWAFAFVCCCLIAVALIFASAGLAQPQQEHKQDQQQHVDHSPWSSLLSQHVYPLAEGRATEVDYQGFKRDTQKLKSYLNNLSAVDRDRFDEWPKQEQLAFLINAYNAWTVALVLQKWPDLSSIKDLGSWFQSPWRKKFIPLLGETRSLDNIEHELIRGSGRYQEPRIHFAVNCASVGCPALRDEAYTADKLTTQLEEQTQLFLADQSRNRLADGELLLSPIFKWYRQDFEQGWQGYTRLQDFLLDYAAALALDNTAKASLKTGSMPIGFLDYDWSLNAKSK
jgi:hypothetical protein